MFAQRVDVIVPKNAMLRNRLQFSVEILVVRQHEGQRLDGGEQNRVYGSIKAKKRLSRQRFYRLADLDNAPSSTSLRFHFRYNNRFRARSVTLNDPLLE